MAGNLPKINFSNLLAGIEQWRQKLNVSLPNEREVVLPPPNSWFEIIDQKTVRFRFDLGPNADAHDVEWGQDPEFKSKNAYRIESDSEVVEIPIHDSFTCSTKYYFRARGVKGKKKSPWSPTAVFSTPLPGAPIALTAGHTVDNFSDENPIINVNITLPRTATIGGNTIEDLEAVWTDHIDLEADWSAIAGGAITAGATTINVTAGQGKYFKAQGFYKIESEIIKVTAIVVDALTVERAQFGTTAAAHADLVTIRFYARVLREQFTPISPGGLYGVTVTIPNDEKVAARTFDAFPVNRCDERGPKLSFALTLALPATISDLVGDPRFQKVILEWSELASTAYRYEIYHATTGAVQINDADPTTTGDTKLIDRPLADHQKQPASGGPAVYTHEIEFATGVFHHYGVRAIDVLMRPGTGDTVGPLQPDKTATVAVPDITSPTASEGLACPAPGIPARARSAQPVSSVTIGFTKPSPIENWDKVAIYLQMIGKQAELAAAINNSVTLMPLKTFLVGGQARGGINKIWINNFYKLDSEVVLVTAIDLSASPDPEATIVRAQQGTSAASHVIDTAVLPFEDPKFQTDGQNAPLEFRYPPIGNVTLYFVSVGDDGTRNDIFSSPNLTIELDGQASAPLVVQSLFCQVTEHGAVIHWKHGLECDGDHYDIADMGNVTAAAQSDIKDEHIIAQIPFEPGGLNRAFYRYTEVLHEGSMSGGGATITMPVDTFVPDSHNGKSLRFAYISEDGGALTDTEYTILDTTDSTIVLTTTPTETSNTVVRFYIGSRTHKFYVRPVNTTSLAGEYRPIEGQFLDCTVLGPDGTPDIAVPKMYVGIPFSGSDIQRTWWRPGWLSGNPGTLLLHFSAFSQNDTDTDFDSALKRSISGVSYWEVEITDDADAITSKEFAASTGKENFTHLPVIGGRPDPFWILQNNPPSVPLPDTGIKKIRMRAKNFFGWSAWLDNVSGFILPPGAIQYTGNGRIETAVAQAAVGGNVDPNILKSSLVEIAPTGTTTIRAAEYLGDGTPGSGSSPTVGHIFTISVDEPDAGATHQVIFSSEYKGLDGKEVDRRNGRYTVWTFQVRATGPDEFRCIGYESGDKA